MLRPRVSARQKAVDRTEPAVRVFLKRHGSLERELRSKLNVPRIVALRRDDTEGRVRRSSRSRIETDTRSEVRMIERIQRLRAKLQPARLAPMLKFFESERFATEYGWLRTLSSVVGTLRIPSLKVRRDPARRTQSDRYQTCRPLAVTEPAGDRSGIAGEEQVRRASTERLATLPFVSAVQLPAADERIEQAVHVVAQRPRDRQLIDTREREPVRTIKRRNAIFQQRVGQI